MALASLHPAALVDFGLQSGGDDIATRVDVFEEIYLFFLALGTLVGIVVVSYMLHKAYKYRAGTGHEYDIDRPQLGELPTGADKGGRKLFVSFGLSALIVISLVGWTYGWLLYVETGAAEVPEDGVEVTVVGEDFAWYYEYHDEERVPQDQVDSAVDDLGEQAVADALSEAEGDPEVGVDEALASAYEQSDLDEENRSTAAEIETNLVARDGLRVPVDREIHIRATSGDVWHNYGVPELRVKADAIPGEVSRTWFVAEDTGEYRAECFELCGTGHTEMTSRVIALNDSEYESWYEGETVSIEQAIEDLESAGDSGAQDGGEATDGGEESDGAEEAGGGEEAAGGDGDAGQNESAANESAAPSAATTTQTEAGSA